MSIQEQISALEDLAKVDAELRTLEEELKQARSTLEEMKGTQNKLEDRLTVDRGSLATAEKARSELVSELRTMNQQLEHSREKMNRARNERETNAVQRELEELRKLMKDREEEAGKLAASAEAIKRQIEGSEDALKQVLTELGSSEGELRSRLADVEGRRTTKLGERDVAIKRLPPPIYRRYDMIRGKRGVGIAQTTDGTCKACHMALPPQLFHRLRREPVIEQCPSCNRLIYFAPLSVPGGGAA